MDYFILIGIMLTSCWLLIAKRLSTVISGFRYQSLFLFIATVLAALNEGQPGLFVVAGLLLAVKVVLIPEFMLRIVKEIKTRDDLGLILNPQLSLIVGLLATYAAWLFSQQITPAGAALTRGIVAVALAVVLIGMFLMVFRLKALVQVTGLLVMENGLFLLATAVAGGMPFFVEIAVFFDVMVSVMILGVFIYRINRLFTHIDVDKLSNLRG
ncbi:hypothetical protein A2311_03395 [candidate division WOR-1 bacterium RIFOXYB2_FULL_48_7]|uniref:Hydrogenase n=1 Tax=candidate division WOR-1 bacterium RIFOXYB2_FULL_48_7 TaxID=1802583 RepID=A0A1F4TRT8_UNCSA|nr:MAG: hypothetical protein A2311_03395 [candidate division WOR-1 bacterium RIFOXYB2_FULL_48_7]